MVKSSAAVLMIVVALTGCASEPQPILTPIEVKVPVAAPVYCKVERLDHPALPIGALQADSAAADTIRAYAATVVVLKGAVRERDLLLDGCAAPVAEQAQPTPPAPGGGAFQAAAGAAK